MASFDKATPAEEVAKTFVDQIKGRIFTVTGATLGGIGAETARALAANGAKLVIVLGRKQSDLQATVESIKTDAPHANVKFVILDLQSIASAKHAAKEVLKITTSIDVIINNAGVMASPYYKTADGLESQFHTNHIGHFVFTEGIRPALSANGRVINLSSVGHKFAPFFENDPGFDNGNTYHPWFAYGQSKTANILYTTSLAAKGVTSFAVHPGSVTTNLTRHIDHKALLNDMPKTYWGTDVLGPAGVSSIFRKTPSQGASTTLVAALDPQLNSKSGAYLQDCQVSEAESHATNLEIADKLWNFSEHYLE